MLGSVSMHLEWNFDKAAKDLSFALELNSDCLIARYRYSDLLVLLGRFAEALKQIQKTLQIDPISTLTYKRLGRLFWKMGRYQTALIYLDEVIELEPDDWEAYLLQGAVLTEVERHSDSLMALEKSLSIYHQVETLAMIGYVSVRLGNRSKSLNIIDELQNDTANYENQPSLLAKIHLAIGNFRRAYQLLEVASDAQEVELIGLKFDPIWKPLRIQPQFKSLVKRVGLPS